MKTPTPQPNEKTAGQELMEGILRLMADYTFRMHSEAVKEGMARAKAHKMAATNHGEPLHVPSARTTRARTGTTHRHAQQARES